ncbi:hypothetical protein [Paenibacillus xylaniclasticus]|uniref:hypothetical protein n=1 Tax=Paenibacillus xylaniclasticus TaxID=588083 RepID=UPI000FDC14FF|nr:MULTISPECIES: hypothetical protein [Paenibacillus]GFN34134.1 hypothetical protein PCURB6_43940 [Paenibacillus curdlanolyticus]
MIEIKCTEVHQFGIVSLIVGRDFHMLNNSIKTLYISFDGLAHILELSPHDLAGSYDADVRDNVLFYRDEDYKVVKLFNLEGIPLLMKKLKYFGISDYTIHNAKKHLE